MIRSPRKHNNSHLDFIRGLPCVVCMDNTSTEAAHVRMADPRAAKRYIGMAEKPDDRWSVPLCGKCHREQHRIRESLFWDNAVIDPIFVCLALHSVSGDHDAGETIIRAAQ